MCDDKGALDINEPALCVRRRSKHKNTSVFVAILLRKAGKKYACFVAILPEKKRVKKTSVLLVFFLSYSRIAAMPGRSLPSRYSNIAPPPVEI